jgi:hypothetical protein
MFFISAVMKLPSMEIILIFYAHLHTAIQVSPWLVRHSYAWETYSLFPWNNNNRTSTTSERSWYLDAIGIQDEVERLMVW